jgi:hypothetical protein
MPFEVHGEPSTYTWLSCILVHNVMAAATPIWTSALQGKGEMIWSSG